MGIKLICLERLSKYRYQEVYSNPNSGLNRNRVVIGPKYMHTNIFVKTTCKAAAQLGIIVRDRVLNAGLLARSQFAFGRSCDWPTPSRFAVVLLRPKTNSELVLKFHDACFTCSP
jgi:hypothetical protein